jgi:hypothetical protein
MKPTIGRIVIYHTTDVDRDKMKKDGNVQLFLPAIIVHVFYDDCVNLKVFIDSKEDLWIINSWLGEKPGKWRRPEISDKK